MPRPIVALAKRYQKDALRIETLGDREGHADIAYQAVAVSPTDIEHAVVNLLRFHEAETAILFCATRDAVRRLHASLTERGFDAVALSGEHSQSERNHALQALRDQRARVCVATDVAARGIDLPSVSLVIHVELPRDAEALQHRSGRTGRAGRKGTAVLIVPFRRRRNVETMLRNARIEAEWIDPPSARTDPRQGPRAAAGVAVGRRSKPDEEDRAARRAADGRACRPRPLPPRWSGRCAPTCRRRRTFSHRAAGTNARRGRRAARRVRRLDLVPDQCRPPPQRRSALAAAADLPLRPCRPQRHRRDPGRRQRKLFRSDPARRAGLHQGASPGDHRPGRRRPGHRTGRTARCATSAAPNTFGLHQAEPKTAGRHKKGAR